MSEGKHLLLLQSPLEYFLNDSLYWANLTLTIMLIFFARQRLTAIPALDYSSTTCSHSASPVSAWSFSPHARHHNFILFIWHYSSPDCISLSRSQYTINGILFSAIWMMQYVTLAQSDFSRNTKIMVRGFDNNGIQKIIWNQNY